MDHRVVSGTVSSEAKADAAREARADAVIDGIRQGWLTSRTHATLPLTDAAEAHRLLEDRRTIGKVLLSAGA